MTTEKIAKIAKEFECKKCEYICSNKYDFNKHLSTGKHTRLQNTNENSKIVKLYKCICGNEYKHNPSLYKHKQTCSEIADVNYKNKIIEDLLKQNNPLLEKVEQNIQSIMALSNFY